MADKISVFPIKHHSFPYIMTAKSAGESGYLEIPIPNSPITGTILSVRFHTGSVGIMGGLQITPIYYAGNEIDIEYYAPKATSNANVTIEVFYY